MLAVPGRQRAQPVRGQELALVEQPGHQPPDLVPAGQAEQELLVAGQVAQHAPVAQGAGVGQALAAQQAGEPLAHDQRPLQVVLVHHRGGQRRDHAHHGADLHRHHGSGRGHQPVVVQAVGLVPQALAAQRVADGREVLEELHHQVRGWPLPGLAEHDRDRAQRHRVEAHPAGGVGLLQDAADGQVRAVKRADVIQAKEPALEQAGASGQAGRCYPGQGTRPRTRCCRRRLRG